MAFATAFSAAFQFTRPRGARPSTRPAERKKNGFNSRAHGGRERHARGAPSPCRQVSIHAPTGGATWSGDGFRVSVTFQFTRPRGARLDEQSALNSGLKFQFTRPRGARQPRIFACIPKSVSIHAPTGGATPSNGKFPNCLSFNSRAHGGRDQTCRQTAARTARFNSRAHGGRDTTKCR